MKIPAFSVSWKTRDIFVGSDEQATPRHEVPIPPLEGEVANEREAEGFVRKLSKKTPLRLAKSRLRRLLACIAPAGA